MILKRRFPNFVEVRMEDWTEHEVNSLEDILKLDWIKKWTYDGYLLYYGDSNKYLSSEKYPFNLIGTYSSHGEIKHSVIGLFTEDPSIFKLEKL
jgi:hypothetical protein